MVATQKAAGVDLFLLEMVGDPVYTACIIRAVQQPLRCDVPLGHSGGGWFICHS